MAPCCVLNTVLKSLNWNFLTKMASEEFMFILSEIFDSNRTNLVKIMIFYSLNCYTLLNFCPKIVHLISRDEKLFSLIKKIGKYVLIT